MVIIIVHLHQYTIEGDVFPAIYVSLVIKVLPVIRVGTQSNYQLLHEASQVSLPSSLSTGLGQDCIVICLLNSRSKMPMSLLYLCNIQIKSAHTFISL